MTATETRPVVRTQVEPRLVERRRHVLEAQRRRRRRRWLVAAAIVALLAAVVGAAWSPLADVDTVSVSGADRLDPAELRSASGIATGDHLALVDLAAARDRLRALPMVAAASVQRQWPDTVRIAVVEEVPRLRVRAGDSVRTVSTTGRFLPDDLDGVDDLPELEVTDASLLSADSLPDALRPALVVFDRVPGSLRDALSVARIDSDGALSFALPDDATIAFGPVEDVPAKLVAIQSFLEQVDLTCLDVLDVREPGRVTASRLDGCAVPAPTTVDDTVPTDDADTPDGTAAGGATLPGDGGTPQ
jgi:cell division protein FtsQ